MASQEAIRQFQSLVEGMDEPLKETFQNMHQGYPSDTLVCFLEARDWNVAQAHKMLVDCLNWRIKNEIDNILAKPITPTDLYTKVRDAQLIGISGYTKQGLPVLTVGVGLSQFDKASADHYVQSHIQMNEYWDRVLLPMATKKYGRHINTCVKVLDMTGLKLSALNHLQLLTAISNIDDLNYPEKTDTYYVVNAPYIFSACWKVVKPLLKERTRRRIQVLTGCGKEELLKGANWDVPLDMSEWGAEINIDRLHGTKKRPQIMDYASLPHFCKRKGSGSSRHVQNGTIDDCFTSDHAFHQQLYNYMKHQAQKMGSLAPIEQVSFHVDLPDPDVKHEKIAKTIESEFHKFGDQNGLTNSFKDIQVDDD